MQYTLQPSGKISVLNRCRLENGGQIQAEDVARVAGKGQPNSILKVRFAPAFLSFIPQVWGDYRIIALSPDYTYALVGDPAREYLWILSPPDGRCHIQSTRRRSPNAGFRRQPAAEDEAVRILTRKNVGSSNI